MKAVYQVKTDAFRSAYNLALADFCKAPEITKYNVAAYTGQIGDKIIIRAIDDFRVEWVKLMITDSANSMIEEGTAVLSPNGADWIYTATVLNPSLAGTKITISAADLPGNITIQEVLL